MIIDYWQGESWFSKLYLLASCGVFTYAAGILVRSSRNPRAIDLNSATTSGKLMALLAFARAALSARHTFDYNYNDTNRTAIYALYQTLDKLQTALGIELTAAILLLLTTGILQRKLTPRQPQRPNPLMQ